MANLQQVLAYLQQHRTRYPIATLKAGLLKQGVPEALIDQAIAALSGTTPPPTQPPGGVPTQRTPVPGQPAPTQPPRQLPFRTPTQIGLPGQRLPVPGQPAPGQPVPVPGQTPVPGQPPVQRPPMPVPGQPPAPTPVQGQPPVPAPVPTQPPAPAPAQPAPVPAPAPTQPGKPGRTYVLVVDDDALIRDMLVAKLEGAGYRVTCAEDAAQSVIQAEGMKLSLIISDIEMPGFGTGVDALKKLRASSFVRRDMPVIFVTGMPPHEAQKIVPKTDPYLRLMHKPVDWRLMRQYIKELTGMDNPLD